MAMDKGKMAKEIIDALKNIDKPADAMSKFSKAIKDHIEKNCIVHFAWSAMMPPAPPAIPAPVPDPLTKFDGEVKFPVFNISMPPISNPDLAITTLGLQITMQVNGGMIMPKKTVVPPITIPPVMFLPIPIMLTASKKDNQKDAMEHLCDQIIKGIKMKINPVPVPGIHAQYTIPAPGAIMTGIE